MPHCVTLRREMGRGGPGCSVRCRSRHCSQWNQWARRKSGPRLGRMSEALPTPEGIAPLQARESPEIRIGGAQLDAMLDRQSGQVGVGHPRARDALEQEAAENL